MTGQGLHCQLGTRMLRQEDVFPSPWGKLSSYEWKWCRALLGRLVQQLLHLHSCKDQVESGNTGDSQIQNRNYVKILTAEIRAFFPKAAMANRKLVAGNNRNWSGG